MPARKVTLLLIAAVIAIGTVIAVRSSMTPESTAPAPQVVVQTTEIAAAAHDLPTGTILKEADLKWVEWPSTADTTPLFVKGQANLSDIAGAVVRDGFRD